MSDWAHDVAYKLMECQTIDQQIEELKNEIKYLNWLKRTSGNDLTAV